MNKKIPVSSQIRRLNLALHRDLGYFFVSLIVIYCISGLALNHANEWNPDFVIRKKMVQIQGKYQRAEVNADVIRSFGQLVGEENYKVYDFPTNDQVKVYYDNASLHVNLRTGEAQYEQVARKPVFYQTNVIHRNSLKGWKWVADAFAILLIVLSITGLFVLKGKYGITGRGKWFIVAGLMPPVVAWILFEVI